MLMYRLYSFNIHYTPYFVKMLLFADRLAGRSFRRSPHHAFAEVFPFRGGKEFFICQKEVLRRGIAALFRQFRHGNHLLFPYAFGIMHHIGQIILFDTATDELPEKFGQLAAADAAFFRQRVDARIEKRRPVKFAHDLVKLLIDPLFGAEEFAGNT